MSTYWAIAAGSEGRAYSDLFLKFGIAFCGDEKLAKTKVGDTIILRQGREKIMAVGRVVSREGQHNGLGDKEWLSDSDFDGWYLPAWCYVDWKKPEGGPILVTGFGRQPPALFQPTASEPRQEAERILATGCPLEETGYKEPEKTKLVADQELLETLVREGLSTPSANELTNKIKNIQDLASYYNGHYPYNDNIPEHEARTFLVVPLLLALGWSEQQLKIELENVDIACFSKPYKNPKESKENCVAVIETKGFANGLDYARGQAESYSDKFPNCKALITTNGYCYKIYLKDEKGSFPQDSYDPSAYINLLNPRDKYPLNPKEGNGALDAIKWLLPNNLIWFAQQR